MARGWGVDHKCGVGLRIGIAGLWHLGVEVCRQAVCGCVWGCICGEGMSVPLLKKSLVSFGLSFPSAYALGTLIGMCRSST